MIHSSTVRNCCAPKQFNALGHFTRRRTNESPPNDLFRLRAFPRAARNPTFVGLWRQLAINIILNKNRRDAPCQRHWHEQPNPTTIVIRLAELGHAIHSLQRLRPVSKPCRREPSSRRVDASARSRNVNEHVKRLEAMSGQVESAATCQIQQSSIVGSGQTLQSRRDI